MIKHNDTLQKYLDRPGNEKGSLIVLFSIAFASVLIMVCLGLEVYLMVIARQQTESYAEILSEAILRRFTLTRNDTAFGDLGARHADAITNGKNDTNSAFNNLTLGNLPVIDQVTFGRWNASRNQFLVANTDPDANAVRVMVTGRSDSLFLDRILGNTLGFVGYKATATAAADESLMQKYIYPNIVVFQ